MALFGVPRLDDAMAENPVGRPVLLENRPGVEAQPFLLQAARLALVAGRAVVYLTTDRPPERVRRQLGAVEGLHVLDAHSALHGIADPEAELISEPDNPQDVAGHLERARRDHPEALLLVDSLSGLAVRAGPERIAAAGAKLFGAISAYPDAVVLYTEWDPETAPDSLLDRFGTRVYLESVEQRIITNNYFRVEAVDGKAAPDASRVLYRVDGDQVRVYIPKIVVTGPADAGKSTFVHAVSDHAVSADRGGSTVAMDRGTIDREGMRVDVFGTPGQQRFDPLVAPILNQAVGIVLMVDSSNPEDFGRARDMLDMGWRKGLHAVVVANKQDLDGALAPADLKEALDLPEGIPVIPCSALDGHAARDVLDRLLHDILSNPEVAP